MTIFVLGAVQGCSHSFYTAEVAGEGAKADIKTHVGVVYLIPPESSQLKMKIVSLGISKNEQKTPELRIRLYFARKTVSGKDPGVRRNQKLEYFDPKEQSIILTAGGEKIYPSRIFGNPDKKPLISLQPNQKQIIELLFPLPPKIKSNEDLESFSFSWKIHYTPHKFEEQVTRFDRQDQGPINNAAFMTDPDYPDFPIHDFMVYPANWEWVPYGWWWW